MNLKEALVWRQSSGKAPNSLRDFIGIQKQVLFYLVVVHLKIQFFFFFPPLVEGVVHGMQDLSSLTKDQTHAPCIGRQILNH